MEKDLVGRIYEVMSGAQEFLDLSLDAQGEFCVNMSSKLRNVEAFPNTKELGVMFVCQFCFRSSKQEPVSHHKDSETFDCPYCGYETTYHADGSSSCREKDVGKYRIKIVCAECHEFIDYKDTKLPEMDGMISHSLCITCGRVQMAELKKMNKK